MRRAAEERQRTVRLWRRYLSRYRWDLGPTLAQRDLQLGRWRKTRRIGGCFHARCYTCHPSKIIGYPTWQEEEAWLRQREALLELGLLQLARRQRLRTRVQPGRVGWHALMQESRDPAQADAWSETGDSPTSGEKTSRAR